MWTFHARAIGPSAPSTPLQNDGHVIPLSRAASRAFTRSSSPFTPTRANGRPCSRSTSFFSCGTIRMHGPHHVAQNTTTVTFPRVSLSLNLAPSTVSPTMSGAAFPTRRVARFFSPASSARACAATVPLP